MEYERKNSGLGKHKQGELMEQLNDSMIFTFHILLLAAKIWLMFAVAKWIKVLNGQTKTIQMVVFKTSHIVVFALALFIAAMGVWFLANFYNPVALELYEQFSIADQIALTVFVAQFLKGGYDGWKQRAF